MRKITNIKFSQQHQSEDENTEFLQVVDELGHCLDL